MSTHRRMDGNTIIVEDAAGKEQLLIRGVLDKKKIIFYLEGSLGTETVHDFEDEIVAASIACNDLAIDMNKLEYISNTAMKVLLQIQHVIDENNGTMVLMNLNDYVTDTFSEKGLMDLFMIE